MTRHFVENDLLIATHNQGKIAEFLQLYQLHCPRTITLHSTKDYTLPPPEETGTSFLENAILKARYYSKHTGLVALADDSGLAVTALGGAPGIYSSRYGGKEGDSKAAMEKLQHALAECSSTPPFHAAFHCALALCWPDGHIETTTGTVGGTLRFPPSGLSGFGYDPIFIPQGETRSFGEMSSVEKQARSHRFRAMQQLLQQCFY